MKLFRHIILTISCVLAISCSKETLQNSEAALETVKYGVSLDAQTRTLGNGRTASHVWYALYRTNGDLVSECAMPAKIDVDGKAICPVTMAKGQNYKIVFVAMYYTVSDETKTPAYAIDAQSKTLYMPTQALANSDEYDLFYGVDQVVNFQGAQSTNVQLDRKVAQVNFEMSESAWNAANITSRADCRSSITLSGVPETMNLLTGQLAESKTDAAYAINSIESTTGSRRIGTAYCLAPTEEQTAATVSATIDFYKDGSDSNPATTSVSRVQIVANKKTNLIIN